MDPPARARAGPTTPLPTDGTALHGVLPMGLVTLIDNHRPGTTANLGIERGGEPQIIKVVVGGPGDGS